jgi:hypothetical protein
MPEIFHKKTKRSLYYTYLQSKKGNMPENKSKKISSSGKKLRKKTDEKKERKA